MKKQNYVALMERDKVTGKYGVVVPDIPGFSTVGDSYEDALKNAVEGLTGHIEVHGGVRGIHLAPALY